ncbi:hypothetical protein PRLR5052_31900 [Prevotella lacticifex]|nr:hypothetical protein PRLR5052_31900 [Prevotella lacticifex]
MRIDFNLVWYNDDNELSLNGEVRIHVADSDMFKLKHSNHCVNVV